jgi:ATP-binding cassette subfamily F protein 3
MQRIAPAHVDSAFEFTFAAPDKLPRPLLTIEHQSVGYGDRVIAHDISFTIAPGDRLALLGRNGAGKSTVMKLLAGELGSASGARTEARDLRIGYFAQHQLEQLRVQETPYAHLRAISEARRDGAVELQLRTFLGGFGFQGDRVFEPVGPFSGGEKARLVLALLAYQRPNLLLLDEPTNHLDLEMRQALAVALQEYEGAVIVVSHDRHLLRVVADQLLLVDRGSVTEFDGDLEDYARWLGAPAGAGASEAATGAVAGTAAAAAAPTQAVARGMTPAITQGAAAARNRKRQDAERRAALAPLRQEVAAHEAQLNRLVDERQQIEQQLAEPALSGQKARIVALSQEQSRLARLIAQTEAAWLDAAERLEASSAHPATLTKI